MKYSDSFPAQRNVLGLALIIFVSLSCGPSSNQGTDLPLARELLLLSQEAEIKLAGKKPDMEASLKTISAMAQELGKRIDKNAAPREKIRAINTYLFDEQGLAPVIDTSTLENTSLATILEQKKGSCVGLVGLYLAMTEKMNLPFYGVLLPGHAFVRYKDDSLKINIETLRQGLERTDSFYCDFFKVPVDDPLYFTNIDRSKIKALFLFNFGNMYRAKGLWGEATDKYQAALALLPDFVEAHANLGNAYLLLNRKDEAQKEFDQAKKLRPSFSR